MNEAELRFEGGIIGRYLVVGIWNMMFGVSVFALVYLFMGKSTSYILVGLIAHPIGVTQSHFMQRKLVWKSQARYLPELAKFALVQTQGFLAIIVLMGMLINIASLPVVLSQIISTTLVTGTSYLLMRYWTFREARP